MMVTGWWWRIVKFGFRLLYNELAFTYDTVSKAVSLGNWRCWQRAALRFLDVSGDGLVLEIAHGTGDLQLDLKAAGYRTVGYDLSPQMGRIAQQKLLRHKLDPLLVRGRAQMLPFKPQSFHAVVCTFPTPFIFEPATLDEVRRVLADRGKLIIVVNGVLTGGGMLKTAVDWLYRITGQGSSHDMPEEVRRLFRAHGFELDFAEVTCSRSRAQIIVATVFR